MKQERMLDIELKRYGESDIYPFHMPGHKRQPVGTGEMSDAADSAASYRIDITEIDGFDNLHNPTGILKEAQERAAALYGAKQSYYLVNGSTCGLLAAICAAVGRRQKVLVARNCHKAVYHALSLWELSADYLYPKVAGNGIAGQIAPEDVKRALAQGDPYADFVGETTVEPADGCCSEAGMKTPYAAVIITSPTYDGVVSDIAAIAEIVHAYDIPLIVDEAHGAHFGLSPHFPASAISLGADLVIQSMHKTLPSYTQTALLHLCSSRVAAAAVEKYLDIFETSSPSYILMAGMEKCIRLLSDEKESLFDAYWEKLSCFYQQTESLQHLRVGKASDFSAEEAYAFDPSKLLIFTGDSGMTGKELYDRLLEEYHLQMEMVSRDYVLAMTSVMDTQEGFDRLAAALAEMDAEVDGKKGLAGSLATAGKSDKRNGSAELHADAGQQDERNCRQMFGAEPDLNMEIADMIYVPQQQVCRISEAESAENEAVSLSEAAGRTSAVYVYLYPPGIPILAPGERITEKNIVDLFSCRKMGLEVIGLADGGKIHCLRED
jgi:arginine/lysine/ornithine decarboxylase